jgi:NDP-sugar pyrophosphorylase family protein
VRAFVLAGGRGSRLHPFTTVIPKPLVPVGEMPIIEILLRQLAAQGFDRVTISVGYLSALIESYCGDGTRWGVAIDYVREDEPLGTAGALSLLTDLAEDRILVTNGDILTDLDLGVVAREHDPSDGATICANKRTVAIDFGVLRTTKDGHLDGYDEKPTLSFEVSMGINVLSAWTVSKYVERGRRLDMPDLMRRLAGDGHRVRVRSTEAYWLDMGRMADLETATEIFTADPARFLP